MPGDLVSEEAVPARPRSSTVMLSLRIERPTFDELSRIAERRGRSLSETAREALRAYVEGPSQDRTPSGQDPAVKAWTDAELERALARYQDACRSARMRDSAWHSYLDYARRFLAWRRGDYRPRGIAPSGRPVPVRAVTTGDLRNQATAYAKDVEAAGRERPTVDTYFRHAMFFVRWLDGDFEPGARLTSLR